MKKIVQGQFDIFQTMYKPLLEDYATKGLLQFSSTDGHQAIITQVYPEPLVIHKLNFLIFFKKFLRDLNIPCLSRLLIYLVCPLQKFLSLLGFDLGSRSLGLGRNGMKTLPICNSKS